MKAVSQTASQSKSANQAVTGILQRKCACGTHTMGGGQCADCAENKSGLQRKLAIGASNDPLEQEADRVADRVLAAPSEFAVSGTPPHLQRFTGQPSAPMGRVAPASVDRVLASPGRPLDPALRQDMEQRFRHDFSGIRVHADGQSATSACEINALAYTVGQNIVFATGHYVPRTQAGQRLLAHELAHTIQQASLGSNMALQRTPAGGSDTLTTLSESLEAIANRIAKLALGPTQTAIQQHLQSPRGPVLAVVRNMLSGEIFVGLNTDIPKELTDAIEKAIEAQKARISSGEVKVIRTDRLAVGGHAEVNALNRAIAARETLIGRKMTAVELSKIFELHNVWLKQGNRQLTTAPRCEHCARITRGVSVTQSMFVAEGGVVGEITVPQRGSVTPSGGTAKPVTSISGEVTVPAAGGKPPAKVTASGGVKVGAANVAVLVVFYWLDKKIAEKEQEWIKKLIAEKLDPAVERALIDQVSTIDRLTAKDPLHPYYANVTADFRYEWIESGIGRNPSMKHLAEIKLTDMKASSQWVNTKQQLDDDCSGWGQVQDCWEIVRVTYPQLLFDPEYEAEKARRSKSWEEFVAENPRWRVEPAPADGEFDKRRWVRAVREIQEWVGARELGEWRKVIQTERERRKSRVEVISVPK